MEIRKMENKTMIQETSKSTTDTKGRHHVLRTWKIVSLKKQPQLSQDTVNIARRYLL
jgi:hypothetical protein